MNEMYLHGWVRAREGCTSEPRMMVPLGKNRNTPSWLLKPALTNAYVMFKKPGEVKLRLAEKLDDSTADRIANCVGVSELSLLPALSGNISICAHARPMSHPGPSAFRAQAGRGVPAGTGWLS
jgi:hypothetical protein